MIVLIPSYEPDQRLVTLVDALHSRGHDVLVVDDGSGARHAPIFTEAVLAGATVITHAVNRGKGAALKTGFAEVARRWPGRDVVCADSDGQHTVADIEAVAARTVAGGALVLGVRAFTGPVPARSRLGNTVTRQVFRLSTGVDVSDTQTGLRGIPADLLAWMGDVPGERFEYEFEVLLRATVEGWGIDEVPIETVYLAENASSHFRPVRDSVRIYRPLVGFCASSLLAFALDTAVLLVMMAVTGQLLTSVVCARLVSATVNYATNRVAVFPGARRVPWVKSAGRYAALAAVVLLANSLLMMALTAVMPLLAAKVVTEVTLVVASYVAQRRLVFATRSQGAPALVSTGGGALPNGGAAAP